ncbi:Uncharacterised protein r2_g4227 [Pycnogonum litorale]
MCLLSVIFTAMSVEGYVGYLSPVKMSKNNSRYFTGKIQLSPEKISKFVSFDSSLHEELKTAENRKYPVMMINVNETSDSIQLNWNTKIRKTAVNFEMRLEDTNDEKPLKLADIKETSDLVSIEVKVLETREKCKQSVYGQEKEKIIVSVADETKVMDLTVWDKQIDQIVDNCFYTLTYLRVKKYMNNVTLTTTPKSDIFPLKEFENVKTSDENRRTVVSTVELVEISRLQKCLSCRKQVSATLDMKFVRCLHCNMRQKTTSLVNCISGTFTIIEDSELMKLKCSENTLEKFFT